MIISKILMLDDTTELHSQFRICIQAGRMATNKMMIMRMMLTVMVMMMMMIISTAMVMVVMKMILGPPGACLGPSDKTGDPLSPLRRPAAAPAAQSHLLGQQPQCICTSNSLLVLRALLYLSLS